MGARLSLHLRLLARDHALVGVCVIKLVKVSRVSYSAPLTFVALTATASTRELLPVEHVNNFLVRPVDTEHMSDVLRRVLRTTVTNLAKFPQGSLSQMD